MFRALALRQSLWRRANARNVSFKTLYGGQFTLSTQLIPPNYRYTLPPTQHKSLFRNLNPLHKRNQLNCHLSVKTCWSIDWGGERINGDMGAGLSNRQWLITFHLKKERPFLNISRNNLSHNSSLRLIQKKQSKKLINKAINMYHINKGELLLRVGAGLNTDYS